MLAVTAHPPGERAINLSHWPFLAVIDEQGIEHVALQLAGEPLRLDVIAGTVLAGPVGLRVHLDCIGSIVPKLVALDRLLRLAGLRRTGGSSGPIDRRLPRLIDALRVADALAEGASLAQIAAGLRGQQLGDLDWPGDGEHVKSRVRRQVALARRLIASGPSGVLQDTV